LGLFLSVNDVSLDGDHITAMYIFYQTDKTQSMRRS
jgi:hypothetical protein